MPHRTLARPTVAAVAAAVGAALIALPGAAHAATTTQVINLKGLSHYTPSGTAPATPWWIDDSRAVGGPTVELANVSPATGVDGSLHLRMNGATDTAAVSTVQGTGIAVSAIATATYRTRTGDPTAVPRYEIGVSCNAGSSVLRLVYDPTLFSNGTPTANTWQTWNAAVGTWYLDQTLNADGSLAPATSAPVGAGLQGGTSYGYSLATIKSHCALTGNRVRALSITAGPNWSAADTYADLFTFNSAQYDFSYDYATRLAGLDRYQTAISTSYNTFGAQKADGVVLARGDLFPDALSGVPLAGVYGGPLLLTPQNLLLPAVLTEIKRVLAPGGTVILMGGTGALGSNVEIDLKAALPGATVTRLAGSDRFATSLLAAQLVQTEDAARGLTFGPVMVATGMNFPDGLAAGPAAFGNPSNGGAVVLSSDYKLTPDVLTYLTTAKANGTPIVAVGGQAKAATAGLASASYAGTDRFATASLLAQSTLFSQTQEYWGLASGVLFPDAMSGGAVMAHLGGPMLLTWPTTLATTSASTLSVGHAHFGYGVIFGGTGAVTDAVAQRALGAASGSSGLLPFSAGLGTLSVRSAP